MSNLLTYSSLPSQFHRQEALYNTHYTSHGFKYQMIVSP